MTAGARKGAASASRVGRLGRFLAASVACVLAVGAALLVIELSDQEYFRVDLSALRHNTLDPELVDVLERLPEPATVDVFLSPLQYPYRQVYDQAAGHLLEELSRVHNARRDLFRVDVHDASDLDAAKAREMELGVSGSNLVVVSSGKKHATLHLFDDVAAVDWGNPSRQGLVYLQNEGISNVVDPRTWDPDRFADAHLVAFRGAEALTGALLHVASTDTPVAVLVQGHGEGAPHDRSETGLSRLATALGEEGFDVEPWTGVEQGPLPEDAAVVLLIGPRQPLRDEDLAELERYVTQGGQVVAAPSVEEIQRDIPRAAGAFLAAEGIALDPGIVCMPLVDRTGRMLPPTAAFARFRVGEQGMAASHPVTIPLRASGRSVEFAFTAAFERQDLQVVGDAGVTWRLETLLTAPKGAWLDRSPDVPRKFDFQLEPGRDEHDRRLQLAVVSTQPAAPDSGGRSGRVLGIGSSTFLEDALFESNRDFLRNAINWLADREVRIRVSTREPLASVIDLRKGTQLAVLSWVVWLGLPAGCALVALTVAWRRRRRA